MATYIENKIDSRSVSKLLSGYRSVLFIVLLFSLFSACKKLVEIDSPPTFISSSDAFANDATAAAVLTDIYSDLNAGSSIASGVNGIALRVGLSADEFGYVAGGTASTFELFYTNNLN